MTRAETGNDLFLFVGLSRSLRDYINDFVHTILTSASRYDPRCHGLPVYAVSVCNKVRLPGTGQSAHVIGGSRFTRPASNSRRTLLN